MTTSTILLAEDEPDSVFFFKYALKKAEVTNPLRVAKDGLEALEYLEGAGQFADRKSNPLPGLVLLDLKMPRATGFEVLKRIRQHPQLRKIIVLIFTASPSDADIGKAYELGANAYLVKPAELENLVKIVHAIKEFWLTYNHPAR